MFNFYVNLAGCGKVSDAGKDTTCKPKFKAASLQTKCREIEWPPENMGFKGKTVWRFQTKKEKQTSSLDQTTPRDTWPLKKQMNMALVNSRN